MTYDVTPLEPQVACPHDLQILKPVGEVAGKRIDQAIVGSCANGRLEDLRVAARVVKRRKSDPNVRFLIFPASKEIYQEALEEHIIQDLADAGAIIMNANCGPCLDLMVGSWRPGMFASRVRIETFEEGWGA